MYRNFIDTITICQEMKRAQIMIEQTQNVALVDDALFRNPEFTFPSQSTPNQPLRRLHEKFLGASCIKILSPALFENSVNKYHEYIIDESTELEFVLSKDCIQTLIAKYPDKLQTAVNAEQATIFQSPSKPPFELVISQHDAHRMVAVVLQGVHGISGLLLATNRSAIDWGIRFYQQYRGRGKHIQHTLARLPSTQQPQLVGLSQ